MSKGGGLTTAWRVGVAVTALASCGSSGIVNGSPAATADRVPDTNSSASIPRPQPGTNTVTTGLADSTPATAAATSALSTDDPPADLSGSTWYLYSIGNAPAGLGPFEPGISVHFTPSATSKLDVSIDARCRIGSGQVELEQGGWMTVRDLTFTEKSCAPDEARVADIIVSVFGQPLRWSVETHQLTLVSASGTAPTLQWRETTDGTPATEPSTP